ncbi:MAG: RidA family protein [Desulfobulbaceae bacterium]|nr:RidA family protein [Desulfobulbaceae bacterium]
MDNTFEKIIVVQWHQKCISNGNKSTQARVTFDNLKSVLEIAGYSLDDVVRLGVWIDDPRDFGEFNKVYGDYFSSDHAPARVTVQAMMMSDLRVEVDCIASKSRR